MTDYNSVKNHLAVISDMTAEEICSYEHCIRGSIEYVCAMLDNENQSNDSRVIHLCAANAYLKIALIKESGDGVSSFKAGDVSFTKGASALDGVKQLCSLALAECREMLKDNGFSFKAV